MQPLVSIIIPTYNYADYIGRALDSVFESDYPIENIQVIVIDDGSTDKTEEVISAREQQIEFVKQENAGKAVATSRGIALANGKYIFNLDADDFFLPNKLSSVVEIFERNPEIVHVGHPAICWNTSDDSKTPEAIPKEILQTELNGEELLSYFYRHNILFGGGSTFAARAECIRAIDIPADVDMYIDEFLLLSLLPSGKSYLHNETLSVWRIHGKNFSDQRENNTEKISREQKSYLAVQKYVSESALPPELKSIYRLKTSVSLLACKEQNNSKSIFDIFELWKQVFKHREEFSGNLLRIISRYHIINRSLPNSVLRILKNIFR